MNANPHQQHPKLLMAPPPGGFRYGTFADALMGKTPGQPALVGQEPLTKRAIGFCASMNVGTPAIRIMEIPNVAGL